MDNIIKHLNAKMKGERGLAPPCYRGTEGGQTLLSRVLLSLTVDSANESRVNLSLSFTHEQQKTLFHVYKRALQV